MRPLPLSQIERLDVQVPAGLPGSGTAPGPAHPGSAIEQSQAGYAYHRSLKPYYAAYYADALDLSFGVVDDDGVVRALVYVTDLMHGELSYFGHPVGVFADAGMPVPMREALSACVCHNLMTLCRSRGAHSIRLPDDASLVTGLPVRATTVHEAHVAFVDLADEEQEIVRRTRKSYRSLVNWGRRSLTLRLVDARDPDPLAFESFRQFHARVAGRRTRSDASWAAQHRALVEGRAFLMLAYLGTSTSEAAASPALVSGNYVILGGQEAYYGVSVNDRELMANRVAVGHWPLLASILEARRCGMRSFNLGVVGPEFATDKERGIAMFKRGFTDRLRVERTLACTLAPLPWR
jgi:hypothetical protein